MNIINTEALTYSSTPDARCLKHRSWIYIDQCVLCIDQLDASTRDSLLRTSLTMWKENLIRFKHERNSLRSVSRVERRSDQLISLTRFQLICCLLYQSSLSLYHVFSSRVSESSDKFRLCTQPSQRWVQSSLSLISAFNQGASDNFFVSYSVHQTSSSSVSVHSISEHQATSLFLLRQCSRQVLRQSSDKFSRVRNSNRQIQSQQHRSTSQQSKLHPTQTRAWLTTSRCHELRDEKMRWERCLSNWTKMKLRAE